MQHLPVLIHSNPADPLHQLPTTAVLLLLGQDLFHRHRLLRPSLLAWLRTREVAPLGLGLPGPFTSLSPALVGGLAQGIGGRPLGIAGCAGLPLVQLLPGLLLMAGGVPEPLSCLGSGPLA